MGGESRPRRVTDFTELETWQVARKLRTEIYTITKAFPAEEKYCLSSQMRRAAMSVTANIAEGYGRFSYQENIQFLRQSRASAYELRDHLTTALDAAYITKEKFAALDELAKSVVRLLNGYIRSTKERRDAAKAKP
jgi:four helix bundle protein